MGTPSALQMNRDAAIGNVGSGGAAAGAAGAGLSTGTTFGASQAAAAAAVLAVSAIDLQNEPFECTSNEKSLITIGEELVLEGWTSFSRIGINYKTYTAGYPNFTLNSSIKTALFTSEAALDEAIKTIEANGQIHAGLLSGNYRLGTGCKIGIAGEGTDIIQGNLVEVVATQNGFPVLALATSSTSPGNASFACNGGTEGAYIAFGGTISMVISKTAASALGMSITLPNTIYVPGVIAGQYAVAATPNDAYSVKVALEDSLNVMLTF